MKIPLNNHELIPCEAYTTNMSVEGFDFDFIYMRKTGFCMMEVIIIEDRSPCKNRYGKFEKGEWVKIVDGYAEQCDRITINEKIRRSLTQAYKLINY